MLAPLVLAAVTLTVDPRVTATFDPRTAFGATIDAHDEGNIAEIFTAANVKAMRSAGFQPLSYRLATELGGEAWHWNLRGTFSDAEHACGYWTSSDDSAQPIAVSYGYRLPRRGNTIDQAHNDSYSHLDDGDPATFWKSNPYLGESEQWFFVDLGEAKPVRSIRISWSEPYATEYVVQRWTGDDPVNHPTGGTWVDFPKGRVAAGRGGIKLVQLADAPITTRYVRVLMTRSSHTAPAGAADPRDAIGFAVAEVDVDDFVRHGRDAASQSLMWVSSTDPWHRAADIDRSMEHAGFDRVFRSGLTSGLPMLTPVALLYGTPEDAAAELRFLRRRGYAVSRIEMGEEPDGQLMTPEDYATLYVRWADALHAVDPSLQLGGPAFQSTVDSIAHWPDARGQMSWIGRFVAALRARDRFGDFNFFSFEWYPFDDVCKPAAEQLMRGPHLLDTVLANWRAEGLPADVPMLATEYGWSSYAAAAEVSIEAALFNAEFVADFLSHGGAAAYFYGLEPDVLITETTKCDAFGNLILFLSDASHHIRHPTAAYQGARLMTRAWAQASGAHELHDVIGTSELLRAWALRRPDGSWSMLVINKDRAQAQRVRTFDGVLRVRQLTGPGEEPRSFKAKGVVELPPYSLTVITPATAHPPTSGSGAARRGARRPR